MNLIPSNNSKQVHFTFKKENQIIEVPTSIYNSVFNNLITSNSAQVIIHDKDAFGNCFWSVNTFYKYGNNKLNTISKHIVACYKLKKIRKLYQTLNKIENNTSIELAEKYLEGFLEFHKVSLDELILKTFKKAS